MDNKEIIELCDSVEQVYRTTMLATEIIWPQQVMMLSNLYDKARKIKTNLEDSSQDKG